jgi:hypothetical protein
VFCRPSGGSWPEVLWPSGPDRNLGPATPSVGSSSYLVDRYWNTSEVTRAKNTKGSVGDLLRNCEFSIICFIIVL